MSAIDDEHVPAGGEGQVLGDGQREPRREDPLDHRVVGGVEQQHELAGGGAVLERVPDGGGVRVGQPHARRTRRRTARRRRSPGPRSGWPARGAAGRRPRRSAASARAPAWSARRSRRPRSARAPPAARACTGFSGPPATAALARAEHRRAAVERLAAAVADPAEPARRRPGSAAARRRTRPGARRVDARRCPPAPARPRGRRRPPARARAGRLAVASRTVANSSQPTPADAAHDEQRSARPRATSVYSTAAAGPVIAAPPARRSMRVARGAAPRRRRPAGLLAGPDQRRRSPASSTAVAGSAGVDQLLAAVDDVEHRVDERRGLGRAAVGVVGATARSAAARPRAAAGRRAAPCARAPGSAPTPTSSASAPSRSASASRRSHPARGARPRPGRRCAAYQAPRASASRQYEPAQVTAG